MIKKRCAFNGCKKLVVSRGNFCKLHAHATNESASAIEQVLRMTELESYKLASLDAELRNHLLAIQNHDLKHVKLVHDFEAASRAIKEEKKQSIAAFEVKNAAYKEFINDLAARYDLDPTKMSFDTESQILRDLRGEAVDEKKA